MLLLLVHVFIMASNGSHMNKQGTDGKHRHWTWMIQQKLEIIGRLESGDNRREVVDLYNVGL